MSQILRLVQPWLMEIGNDDLYELADRLTWLQKELFDEYEPNQYESFDDRVSAWLNNLNDDDHKKSMFRLLEHLFFVGKKQFDSLCRAAYSGQVTRWILDHTEIDLVDPNLTSLIDLEMRHTWFCPITDSMRINSFLKLNNHPGHDHRPDWRSLRQFADAQSIRDYVTSNAIRRLVLLEDFVGSGDQMKEVVAWASRVLDPVPILVVPLVCCPIGAQTGEKLAKTYSNVDFEPTLTLRPNLFLLETPQSDEPAAFTDVRVIIKQAKPRLGKWKSDLFGYEATGAIIALYSNCPDNTLPIIHHHGPDWAPLFSRVRRS